MIKYLNQNLFKEETIASSDGAFSDLCITPPDFVQYDEEHPRPEKPFLKVRVFPCDHEEDRKLNVRGIITKNSIHTFRVSSGDRNTGDDVDLYLIAIPFRGYLDETKMPDWIRILKNRIVISAGYTIKMGGSNYSKMLWLVAMVDKDKVPAENASFSIHFFYPERTRKKGSKSPEKFPTGKTVYVDRSITFDGSEFHMNAEEPTVIEGEPERIKHPFSLYSFPDSECLRFDKPKKTFVKNEDDGSDKPHKYGHNDRNNGGNFNKKKNGKKH